MFLKIQNPSQFFLLQAIYYDRNKNDIWNFKITHGSLYLRHLQFTKHLKMNKLLSPIRFSDVNKVRKT